MKGASDDKKIERGDKPTIQRIPTIRLKLKVKSEPETEPRKEKEPLPLFTETEPEPMDIEDVVDKVSASTSTKTPSLSSSLSSSLSKTSSQSRHCGTFKYRPFKLYPLLSPLSRYHVLVPHPYTSPSSNPALPLNYLWSTPTSGVYTDDSDLVCVALGEGWCGVEEMRGKDLMIEVEVVNDGNQTDKVDQQRKSTYPNTQIITPRTYPSPHDGNYIRILSVILNPSAVHLKRWRKHGRTTGRGSRNGRKERNGGDERILTPKFKTGCGSGS